ncbi:hypothetical protein PUN28_005559 [Cardiocondyla obscurior]|uniref:Uncharacterized protein n=1 Tax=Cardiocondyla obscurior TaxID=286306 RepID=A0AAW2GGK3_9HYME
MCERSCVNVRTKKIECKRQKKKRRGNKTRKQLGKENDKRKSRKVNEETTYQNYCTNIDFVLSKKKKKHNGLVNRSSNIKEIVLFVRKLRKRLKCYYVALISQIGHSLRDVKILYLILFFSLNNFSYEICTERKNQLFILHSL